MEAAVRENIAIRWFVGFFLDEKTSDRSCFEKFRKRIGTKHLVNIFNSINENLQKEGLMRQQLFQNQLFGKKEIRPQETGG